MIAIVVEGGLVQYVATDLDALKNQEIVVIDRDTEGLQNECEFCPDFNGLPAYIYHQGTIAIDKQYVDDIEKVFEIRKLEES